MSGILVLCTEMNPSSNYEVKLSLTTYTTPKYNRSSIQMHFSIYTCNNLRSLFNNYKNIKRPPSKKTKISVTLRNVYRTLPQSSFIIVSQTFSKFADIHLLFLYLSLSVPWTRPNTSLWGAKKLWTERLRDKHLQLPTMHSTNHSVYKRCPQPQVPVPATTMSKDSRTRMCSSNLTPRYSTNWQ